MTLDLSRCPALSRHADLKCRAEGDILVLPERAVRLGGSGGEILRLCDGRHRGDGIVSAMRERYSESPEIEAEIVAFLDEMFELGGIVLLDDPTAATP